MNVEAVAPACPDEEADTGVQGETSETSETSQELETRTAAEALGADDAAWHRGIELRKAAWATAPQINVPQALGLLARGEVLQHMRAAVAAMGEDFVYNPGGSSGRVCYNVAQPCFGEDDPRAKTGCLVGRILLASGRVSKEFLEGHAQLPWDFFAEKARMTYDAGLLLGVAQRIQDTGGTWGEALRVCTLMAEVMCVARERRLEV